MKGLILAVVGATFALAAGSAVAADSPEGTRATRFDLLARRSQTSSVDSTVDARIDVRSGRTRAPIEGAPVEAEGLPELEADGITLSLPGLVVEGQRASVDMKPAHPRPRFVVDRVQLEGPELAEIANAKTPTSAPVVDRIGGAFKD